LKIKKIFAALGNDRPQILVQLEDSVLHAIIDISKGKSSEAVIDALHLHIQSVEKDLLDDDDAMNWFDLCKKNNEALNDQSVNEVSDLHTSPPVIPSPGAITTLVIPSPASPPVIPSPGAITPLVIPSPASPPVILSPGAITPLVIPSLGDIPVDPTLAPINLPTTPVQGT
jgi:hypothetical protein